uniref:Uncharacterized protein n=1 Tax=Arundo donax TaxID=35708 RepID=A0A0A9C5F6_ARUDO
MLPCKCCYLLILHFGHTGTLPGQFTGML